MPPVAKSLALLAGIAGMFATSPASAAIDWATVQGKDVVLYYPGQSNWEWALNRNPVEMPGAPYVRQGKTCRACHEGMEEFLGGDIVTGTDRTQMFADNAVLPSIEPTPIKDKPGAITLNAKFAHDDTNLYVHLDIDEGQQPDAGQDANFATKVAVMFSPSRSPDVVRTGCYAACHNDDTTNPGETPGVTRTMYLGRTRAKLTRQGGGDTLKPADELARLRTEGYFLEYWQARLNPGKPATPATLVVFDKREEVANVINADASYAGGKWSITLRGRLDGGPGLISFSPGKIYTVAFAVHAGHTARRFHNISGERTLAIDAGVADFIAKKQ